MQNQLSSATSPYLLQHANNPVHWQQWSDETLAVAIDQNKPILLSIGYSACHWCHVMEKESFELPDVAAVMNKYFICIKLDREERPDVDAIYMDAVQLMGIGGGWPLNVFLLPDLRPFYGGTYFRKDQWVNICKQIGEAYKNHYDQLATAAEDFTNGLHITSTIANSDIDVLDNLKDFCNNVVGKILKRIDLKLGGLKGAPKFPMPVLFSALLSCYRLDTANTGILDAINATLKNMCNGGLYDLLAGGFSRYSVDEEWRVPHFEKMLYDNAQLIGLYAETLPFVEKVNQKSYQDAILKTFNWLQTEMFDTSNNAYYTALDADSDGVEGKFYCFTTSEFEGALSEFPLQVVEKAKEIYNIIEEGNFEHNLNILSNNRITKVNSLSQKELVRVNGALLDFRNKNKNRPGLDNKLITSHNALLISGLAKVALHLEDYHVLTNDISLTAHNLFYSLKSIWNKAGNLPHLIINQSVSAPFLLEDYAYTCAAAIDMFRLTALQDFLDFALEIAKKTLELFDGPNVYPQFMMASASSQLLVNKAEVNDSVQPSSNSVMAHNLHFLGTVYNLNFYLERAKAMLANVLPKLKEGSGGLYLSNWLKLASKYSQGDITISVSGNAAESTFIALSKAVSDNVVITIDTQPTNLSTSQALSISICKNNVCLLPINTIEEALLHIWA